MKQPARVYSLRLLLFLPSSDFFFLYKKHPSLAYFPETAYLCFRKKTAALIGLGNSSIFMEYRDKFRFSMAGHALRGNL